MKNYLRFISVLFAFIFQSSVFGNTVIVKGYVSDSANHAVANRTVKIYSTDSTNGGCVIGHTKVTNPNGYYIDTLSCTSGDIRKISVIVENCNGIKIIHEIVVNANNLYESNFIICTPTTIAPGTIPCKAAFSFVSQTNGVKFNGTGSFVPTGDSIISRTWNFGDSSQDLNGNIVDPLHAYNKPGIYTACLTIKTKKGCESKYCATVVFTPSTNDCAIKPTLTIEKLSNRLYKLNSSQSSTAAGDSIFQRIWKFSDGSSLDGNQINPTKQFRDTGSYSVCVSIRTVKGCEKEICLNIVVKDSINVLPVPTNCKAVIAAIPQGRLIKFNSKESQVPLNDSIISRTWLFGDSSATLTGNRVDPTHEYAKPGTYTACLYIKTKSGCESIYCLVITVKDTIPTGCKAYFNYTIKDSLIVLNSSGSVGSSPSDSIISRTWSYTDSTGTVSLTGNVITPSYAYTKPGSYKVLLVIKTRNGCESNFTGTVVIAPKPIPTSCKANFTYTIKDSLILFNSSSSVGSSPSDSIISRLWSYTDSSTSVSLPGNVISPSYVYPYTKPGAYKVTLVIKTQNGCENKFIGTVVIAPKPIPLNCRATFSYTIDKKTVKFNSSASVATSNLDSIVSRIWIFGDSTIGSAGLQGNQVDPIHIYSKAGTYHVYLYIKTKAGCESKYEATVVIAPTDCAVQVAFKSERISLKKVQFNSSITTTAAGDSVVERIWNFGDNTSLKGNVISPLKEFPLMGIYNTCLEVKTVNGCEAKTCVKTVVQDTMNTPQAIVDYVKIITINPNPVITRMVATIYSRNSNIEAEISIFDIYGTPKLNLKKLLSQGNNMIEIGTEFLPHGPFFLKVSTKNGRDSKAFYKL